MRVSQLLHLLIDGLTITILPQFHFPLLIALSSPTDNLSIVLLFSAEFQVETLATLALSLFLLDPHVDGLTSFYPDGSRLSDSGSNSWLWTPFTTHLSRNWVAAEFNDVIVVYGGGFSAWQKVTTSIDGDVILQSDILSDNMIQLQFRPAIVDAVNIVGEFSLYFTDEGCASYIQGDTTTIALEAASFADFWPYSGPTMGGTVVQLIPYVAAFNETSFDRILCHFESVNPAVTDAPSTVNATYNPATGNWECISPRVTEAQSVSLVVVGYYSGQSSSVISSYLREVKLGRFDFTYALPELLRIAPGKTEITKSASITVTGQNFNGGDPHGDYACLFQRGAPDQTSDDPSAPGTTPTWSASTTLRVNATRQPFALVAGVDGATISTFVLVCQTSNSIFPQIGEYPFEVIFSGYRTKSNYEFDVLQSSVRTLTSYTAARNPQNTPVVSEIGGESITIKGTGLFGGRLPSFPTGNPGQVLHTSAYLCQMKQSGSDPEVITVGVFNQPGGQDQVVCVTPPRSVTKNNPDSRDVKFSYDMYVSIDGGYSYTPAGLEVFYVRDSRVSCLHSSSSSLASSLLLLIISVIATLFIL